MKINKDRILTILLFATIPLLEKLVELRLETILSIIFLWVISNKYKKIRPFCLLLLLLINLGLNRLLTVEISPLSVSFDVEQSFLDFPGIENSIMRYRSEGLWLPYRLRNIFYGTVMLVFPWITSILKLLSLSFWARMVGFSGVLVLGMGLWEYLLDKRRNFLALGWFLVVVLSSAMRVIGDSRTMLILTAPSIFVWFYYGFKSKAFGRYKYWWMLLFLVDLLLR